MRTKPIGTMSSCYYQSTLMHVSKALVGTVYVNSIAHLSNFVDI